jgi:hypothetical protein
MISTCTVHCTVTPLYYCCCVIQYCNSNDHLKKKRLSFYVSSLSHIEIKSSHNQYTSVDPTDGYSSYRNASSATSETTVLARVESSLRVRNHATGNITIIQTWLFFNSRDPLSTTMINQETVCMRSS